ncbi:HEAT repeat domain-containing protein [Paenibacillus senegalimassiliensis]|uniref:HEAT repeat domain-containing protein n=1 Tax=Paenibacillus senegalimassiliensis TaxID=1737426 RepID=UPI0009E6E92F|nr:hypothetical protein [Paenibacillus senegalimassiliensis]
MTERLIKFNRGPLDHKRVLKELDSLGYSDRMKRIALLSREYQGDEQYSKLLLSLLDAGSAYEAHLALTGAAAAHDTQTILLALKHPKAGVKCRAAGLLPEVVEAEKFAIEQEIVQMSADCRRKLLHTIVVAYRKDWAERLLPIVLTRWGGHEAAILLSACGEETVRTRLPELGYALHNWGMLTRRYPDLVATYVQATLSDAPLREKGAVWWRLSTAMETLSELRPSRVLEFALKLGPLDVIHPVLRGQLGLLMQANPEGVFKLLAREESRSDFLNQGVPQGILKRRSLFSIEQWTQLVILLADKPLHVAKVLDTLAPACRGAIFAAVYDGETRRMSIFPEPLLDALPHQVRDREAARMLGLRDVQNQRRQLIHTTARRSITHARELLEQASRASSPEDRALAYAGLIKSTALSRRGMEESLRFLTRIKNDQDLVRGAVLEELASCPVTIFEQQHIEALNVLVDSVIEARDTSYTTRTAVEKLAFALLRHHALSPENGLFQFALRTFGRLSKRDGQLMLPKVKWESLPDQAAEILFDEIYAQGVEANKRENYNFVLRMAASFGKHGHRLPKLQLLLEQLVKAKSVSSQAVYHWLAPYATRDQRVRELLDRDPSFIAFYEVFAHLHRKRQEWLDPFISGAAIKGKHLSGKTIYLIPATEGFYRWLPRQQKALGLLLERVASDGKRSFYERANAIRSLAALPDFYSEKLAMLLEDEEVHIVEAALHAHSLLEEPAKALPILMDHLDGDRARVAMYSIPRCVRRLEPVLLTAVLSDLLNRERLKITVRKEAIRLLGAFRSDESLPLLIREYEKPQVHKDVLIAIGHAARQCLDDERSWTMLSSMAASPQPDVVRSLLGQGPNELPAAVRSRYLQFIVEVANHPEASVGRDAFYAMIPWANGNEAILATAAGQAILDLQSQDSFRWKAAVEALLVACQEGKINEQVLAVYKALLNAEMKESWNATAERDLPHRQRLLKLTDKLTILPQLVRKVLSPLYLALIDELKPNATMDRTRIKLYLAVIDWSRTEEAETYLQHIAQVVNGQPHLLDDAYSKVAQSLTATSGEWKSEELLELVDRMSTRQSFESSYLGLAVLKVVGKVLSWNSQAAGRLRVYRNHEEAAIRSCALDIWTADE